MGKRDVIVPAILTKCCWCRWYAHGFYSPHSQMQNPLNNDPVEIAVKFTPFLPTPILCLFMTPGHLRPSACAHREGRVGGRGPMAVSTFMKRISPSLDLSLLQLTPTPSLGESHSTDGTAQVLLMEWELLSHSQKAGQCHPCQHQASEDSAAYG